MMGLRKLADALERDRHEPDKVILYAFALRRMATELEQVHEWAILDEGKAPLRLTEAWAILEHIVPKEEWTHVEQG